MYRNIPRATVSFSYIYIYIHHVHTYICMYGYKLISDGKI